MIQHHTGALIMVKELFANPGAGQDAFLFDFANDVDNTQTAEIDIMRQHAKGETMNSNEFPAPDPKRTYPCTGPASSVGILCCPDRQLRRRQLPAKTPPQPPSVYVNPRSGPDDPRVGLKGGLYDAATAKLRPATDTDHAQASRFCARPRLHQSRRRHACASAGRS